jgi:exoribonuclease R
LKIRIVETMLEKDPAKKFDCLITRVLNSGIQVELPEYAIYAFVPDDDLKVPLSTLKIGSKITIRGDRLLFQNRRK